MKFLLSSRTRACAFLCACALALAGPVNATAAKKLDRMEDQSSDLKEQLSDINEDLLQIGEEIEDVKDEIETIDGEIEMTREQLAIARNRENEQYDEMKLRIKYMYENDSLSMLEVLVASKNMAEFLNRVEFIQNVSDYDREKLEDFQALRKTISDEEKKLVDKQESQQDLQDELASRQADLRTKAKETSVSLSALNKEIQKLREEEARRKAEEERKAAEAARKAAEEERARKAAQRAAANSPDSGDGGQDSSDVPASSPSVDYDMPSGDGVLTKHKGVNYYNGHKETYYSQRVLPGGGLNIPGRHVASDGTIRDEDGYICVASNDYPKGTVVDTSLGPGKVYDCGCASGIIDIYTDW